MCFLAGETRYKQSQHIVVQQVLKPQYIGVLKNMTHF